MHIVIFPMFFVFCFSVGFKRILSLLEIVCCCCFFSPGGLSKWKIDGAIMTGQHMRVGGCYQWSSLKIGVMGQNERYRVQLLGGEIILAVPSHAVPERVFCCVFSWFGGWVSVFTPQS